MTNLLDTDPGKDLLVKLCRVASQKLDRAALPPFIPNPAYDPPHNDRTQPLPSATIPNPEYVNMPAGEMAAIIKLLSDNSVTLANIRRGDFGETLKRAEEDYPFNDGGRIQGSA